MKASLICCSLLVAGAALAAPGQDRPQDYAWNMPIQSPAGAGIVQLTLPREVYLHASSASLADLRLFDADGKRLAYAIGAPPAQSATQRTNIPARIFPVTGAPATGDGLQGIDIRTADDGRLLSVSTRAGTAAATAALQALILDLGKQAQDKRIAALRFTPPARTDNYSAQVLLEVSDDLKQWDAIGTTTLNWLSNSDTQTLANDSIAFAPRAFRYARLSWQAGEPLAFAAITAQAVSETDIAAPRASVVLQGLPGKQANEWRYATPLAMPADSIALQLTQTNTVLPVTLGVYRQNSYVPRHRLHLRQQARPAQGAYFDPLLSTTFYRIGLDGKERISGDLAMPVTQTNEWVLQTSTEHPLSADNAPALRLSWTPATVVFLASGKPPYQLAFGNGNAAAVAQPLAQVAPGFRADELLALKTASAGQLKPNGGVAAPAPATKDGAGLRLTALWAALLLGVAVLGFFAWRLLSQMKEEQGSTDKHEH
ncbi:hypothetical protein CNX70_22085 [Janthinobacterium svalbardensis]|uniref:DUF3999 domain-containing protein n=1 Tax=Janthinobacterium svalbardensis TaxID=368607 RepID=A0A290X061_9BURK|nr:DUF3999 family protein [Janthinobacterium svalbardensis]ATD62535.1 hypothetical protein CNX70_22085 [Janthinobacterium svalbardensis]